MSRAIEVEKITKTYRVKSRRGLFKSSVEFVEAVKGISFTADYGSIVCLLGPNGAGKTTTIKILATLLLPDSGSARVAGYDVVKEAGKVRENIGLMLTVEKGFYGKLNGRENLEYFAALYGLPRDIALKRIDHLVKLLELDKLGADRKLYEEFSLGMKARLSLARALLKDAPILLLDEPTLGLDPPSARKIRELVREMAHRENKSILYTTHNMFEAEIVCDRILLINKGVIVAEGSPEELKDKIPKLKVINLVIKASGDPGKPLERFTFRKEIKQEENSVFNVKIYVPRPEDVLGEIVKTLVNSGHEVVNVRMEEPSLEDVFIYYSEGSI